MPEGCTSLINSSLCCECVCLCLCVFISKSVSQTVRKHQASSPGMCSKLIGQRSKRLSFWRLPGRQREESRRKHMELLYRDPIEDRFSICMEYYKLWSGRECSKSYRPTWQEKTLNTATQKLNLKLEVVVIKVVYQKTYIKWYWAAKLALHYLY